MKRAILAVAILFSGVTLPGTNPGSGVVQAAADDRWAGVDRANARGATRVSSPAPQIECIPPPCELPPVDCERIKRLKARCRIDDAIGIMRVKVRRRVTIPDARVDESVLLVINGQPQQELCCAIFLGKEKKVRIELPGRIGPQQVQIVDPPRCPFQAQTDCR